METMPQQAQVSKDRVPRNVERDTGRLQRDPVAAEAFAAFLREDFRFFIAAKDSGTSWPDG